MDFVFAFQQRSGRGGGAQRQPRGRGCELRRGCGWPPVPPLRRDGSIGHAAVRRSGIGGALVIVVSLRRARGGAESRAWFSFLRFSSAPAAAAARNANRAAAVRRRAGLEYGLLHQQRPASFWMLVGVAGERCRIGSQIKPGPTGRPIGHVKLAINRFALKPNLSPARGYRPC
jgi:hypothetical protein